MAETTRTLWLWKIEDGSERHYAVADSPEAAIRAASYDLFGDEGDLLIEYPETRATTVEDEEQLTVHYAEDGDMGREIAARSEGLIVTDDTPDDSGVPYVSGPATAWIEAYRDEAPAFVASTVF